MMTWHPDQPSGPRPKITSTEHPIGFVAWSYRKWGTKIVKQVWYHHVTHRKARL